MSTSPKKKNLIEGKSQLSLLLDLRGSVRQWENKSYITWNKEKQSIYKLEMLEQIIFWTI